MLVNDDILFPADADTRAVARRLFAQVRGLALICPHGHTDPAWFAQNQPFADPAHLFVVPDHYIFRMLYSQGISLEDLGIPRRDGRPVESDPRKIWRLFAAHYHLFAGTPTRAWLDQSFATLFGFEERLSAANADDYFDKIADCLTKPEFTPRALYERFNIEVIATTESPLDPLTHHRDLRGSGWSGRVITTYRPDAVVDPEFENFTQNLERFAQIADTPIDTWAGYLEAHRVRRAYFRDFGATATDHGHPSAGTADLELAEAQALYATVASGRANAGEAEIFRAQMLTEMAKM
ncbi:MAG: glucuronate isomerase, partial [Alphaproteobacteria bacterium]